MPNQYEPQEQEMDEFVVAGDEEMMLDVDPDSLPTMVCCPAMQRCSIKSMSVA